MSHKTAVPLPDIQHTLDSRGVPIRRVGVTGIKLPIQLKRSPSQTGGDPLLDYIDTVGTFELACSLPATVKGTHMSRFTEVLNAHIDGGGNFSIEGLQEVAYELAEKLGAASVFLKVEADYFISQRAPVSLRPGMAPLKGILQVEITDYTSEENLGNLRTWTGIEIEGKTCCPCSRLISEYDPLTKTGKGAHAQRGKVSIMVEHNPNSMVWFEELVHIAWRAFSQPVYPVLKRVDERHITMNAYANPKFVEDVVRDVICQLREFPRHLRHWKVRVENAESIHYHNAYAEVES